MVCNVTQTGAACSGVPQSFKIILYCLRVCIVICWGLFRLGTEKQEDPRRRRLTFFPSKNRPLMSRRGSELGPFPGINGVKAPFFSFALQNATKPKHLRMACKKLVGCKKIIVMNQFSNHTYMLFVYFQKVYYLSSHSQNF